MSFPYTFPIIFGEDIWNFVETPIMQSLRLLVWDDFNKGALLDDFTDEFTQLTFSTALHGGFARCQFEVPMNIDRAWLYMQTENLPGRHFAHVEVLEENTVVWEGRIMVVGIDPSGARLSLRVEAAGYWNSCRDQFYDAADAGNTDWTSGTHTIKDIIAEMLTGECPSINSDQSGLEDPGLDVGGIDLTARDYVQNIIAARLPMTSDGSDIWDFAIWEDRKPYLKVRSASILHWTTYLSELGSGSRLDQDAYTLRNSILPVKDGTEGTAAADSDRRSSVPVREFRLDVQKGVPTAAENHERDLALAEKKDPKQSQSFNIEGRVWSTKADGMFIGQKPWRIRAGDVIRIADLVPASITSPSFDSVRTFFITETHYNAMSERMTITPDKAAFTLSTIIGKNVYQLGVTSMYEGRL
jgi:hypothetical protein